MSLQVIPASQRLTFDVLWHLFGYVCLSDPLKGPVSVSRVSHLWRLVALLSPFMWCHITIRLNTSSQQHFLASAYLKRSQNAPIKVTINATRHFKSWEKMELLQPHAHRFRSLHVKASAGSLASLLWMEMNMPMPCLEEFDTVISNTSCISINGKIVTIDENVNIVPPVCHLNMVHWDLWNPIGLTVLTLDTTRLWNPPDLDDIYHALATTSHTLQHFEYRGLFACTDNAEVNARTRLVFPALRSLAVLCHDNMVPLLELMIIPALDSLSLRDFTVYPAIPAIFVPEPIDIDELTLTFDPDGLFQVIKQWTAITRLEIFGIDDLPSHHLSSPELLTYIKSLNQLTSLVLYGIGAATSIAYTLFMHDPTEEPLFPKLSCFLLGIVEMSPYDTLSQYLITRRRHQLPRLQKLSINLDYALHLCNLNCIDILCDSSDEVFIFADPEVGNYIPISEVKFSERLPRK